MPSTPPTPEHTIPKANPRKTVKAYGMFYNGFFFDAAGDSGKTYRRYILLLSYG